jgi:hypothetical protein
MKKLNEQQIKEIKELAKNGVSYREISRRFGVKLEAIKYHLLPEFKERAKELNRLRYKKMSSQEKRIYFDKKKKYQREYHRNRYNNDKEFRNKQIERAKEYQKKKGKKQ